MEQNKLNSAEIEKTTLMLDSSLPRSLECHRVYTSEPFADFCNQEIKIYFFDWDMKKIHLFKVEP